jgi:hypothetical protein
MTIQAAVPAVAKVVPVVSSYQFYRLKDITQLGCAVQSYVAGLHLRNRVGSCFECHQGLLAT